LLIKIWDTAGQEKFASITKNYYQRAHGMIVTCALDNRKSFTNLKNWLYSIKENNTNNELPIVIVANKCDLDETREIRKEEIFCLSKEWNTNSFETSAKNGINVDEAFDYIINKIYKSIYKKSESFNINEKTTEGNKKVSCCK